MKPLYEYANEYQKVIDLMENSDEITQELMDMLESVSNDSKDKVKNVAAYIKNLETHSENMRNAIDKIVERQIKVNKKVDSLKNYLRYNMETLDIKELNTPEFDVKIRYNNYSLHIDDTSTLPTEYIKQKVTQSIDKLKIIKDLKNDVIIPGACFLKTSTINIK